MDTVGLLRHKSHVLPVGIDLRRLDPPPPAADPDAAPLILWNQRLEFDKNPESFISLLVELAEAGGTFRVAPCGERFGPAKAASEAGGAPPGPRGVPGGAGGGGAYPRRVWACLLKNMTPRTDAPEKSSVMADH